MAVRSSESRGSRISAARTPRSAVMAAAFAALCAQRRIVGRNETCTFAQSFAQAHRPAMFAKEIGKSLVRQLLQRLHAVARKLRQSQPGFRIKADQLAARRVFRFSR